MNIAIKLIIFLGGLLLGMTVFAQTRENFFEGTVNYEVKFSGPTADMYKANEPNKKVTAHLKGGDYIIGLGGGRYPKTFLFVADSNREFSMDMSNRKAYRHSSYGDKARETGKVEVNPARPTGRTAEIKGVVCQEYRLVKKDKTIFFYVNDDYRVDMSAYPAHPRSTAHWLAPGLEGRIPFRIILKRNGLSVMTDLVAIKAATFDPAQFRIPEGFEVKGRDYRF